MSGIESIRANYSQENELQSITEQMFSVDEEIETHKSNLQVAEIKRNGILTDLKDCFVSALSISEMVKYVIDYFDESGEFLGIESSTIDQISENIEQNVEDVIDCIRGAVIRLTIDSDHLLPIVKRRWNLHLLAVIFQLRQFECMADSLEVFLESTFNNLCDLEHDWNEMTATEKEILHKITESMDQVPNNVKNLLKNLIAQIVCNK